MRGERGAGVGLELEGGAVRDRAAVADDLRAPARPRGEDAVIHKPVHRGVRNEGRQLLQEFEGLEEEVRHAIAPHRLEFDEDAPVGTEADAVLGERGAEEIAAELFEASAIVGGDPDVGVKVEAVELSLTRAAGGDMTEVRLVTEAADAGAGAGPEGERIGVIKDYFGNLLAEYSAPR